MDSAWLRELPDSALVGSIGPLLRELLRFNKSVPESAAGVRDLIRELENLHVSLKYMYEAKDPSHTARWWVKEVRDLCHEIEDYWDECLSSPIQGSFGRFIDRLNALSKTAESSKLTAGGFKKAVMPDPAWRLPLPAPSIKDLVAPLAFDAEHAKQLRAVTLFGLAGSVNTRAASTLYDLYRGRFERRAFVRMSQDPDLRSILTSILSQIKAPPDDGFSDVDKLLRRVNNHLHNKRYLIVIDDLWSTPDQNFIMGAFPGGYCHSRIITTTRSKDVALASSDSYLQKVVEVTPLNQEDESEGNRTPERMKEELNRIYNELSPELKTCLLYLNMYQPGNTFRKDDLVKQWIVEDLILTNKSDSIQKLAGDYFDELVKRELIQPVERNWKEEVLSYTVQQNVMDMIAMKCKEVDFITTVNYLEKTGLPDKAHRLSIQFRGQVDAQIPENIVLARVRSLAFSGLCGCVPSIVDCKLLQVLILNIWADRGHGTFDLSRISELFLLKYVKVACNVTVNLPDKIVLLTHLKTLEVDATIATVPSDITNQEGLVDLSLPSANLPSGVSTMTSLCSLGCFDLSRHPEQDVKGILNMASLEDLHLTCSGADQEDMQKKMDLIWCLIFSPNTSLRSLDLAPTGSNLVDTAFLSIEDTCADAGDSCDVSTTKASTSASPSVLERLELSPRICIFSRIPNRFDQLGKLRILKIAVKELSWEDIDVLKTLPALAALSLYVWVIFGSDKADTENQKKNPQTLNIGKDGFSVLSYLKFTCPAPCLSFLHMAMPSVRRLKLRFNASSMGEYRLECAGLENLAGLQEISVKIVGSEFHLREAQSVLGSAFPNHEVPPVVNVKSVVHIFCASQVAGADSRYGTSLKFTGSTYIKKLYLHSAK